jgi:hypothetical protein
LTLDGGTVCLRGAATELFKVESGHAMPGLDRIFNHRAGGGHSGQKEEGLRAGVQGPNEQRVGTLSNG